MNSDGRKIHGYLNYTYFVSKFTAWLNSLKQDEWFGEKSYWKVVCVVLMNTAVKALLGYQYSLSACLGVSLSSACYSSFLPVSALGVRRQWLPYLGPCCPCGRPEWVVWAFREGLRRWEIYLCLLCLCFFAF